MRQIFRVLVATLGLGGCGTAELFDARGLAESPEVASAPWPQLVDVPPAPPVGQYSTAVPDPARGVAALADLGAVAEQAGARANVLAAPVLSDADRAALGR